MAKTTKNRICPDCRKRKVQSHKNSKWCLPCALDRRKRPRSTLTSSQINWVERHIGKMPVTEMAGKLDTSVANVKRAFRGKSLWFKNGKYKYQPELVRRVLRYYEKHGKPATIEKFPEVNVKCIVDRPEYYGHKREYRQIRWTDEQLADLARMGGLVSFKSQAKYFNRPRAFEGSIKSAWIKKFGYLAGEINGMKHNQARHLVTAKCPWVDVHITETRIDPKYHHRRVYLWVDMEKHLRSDCPEFIREAIVTLAEFQRWLFESENPRRKILAMIRRIEV